MRAVWLAALPIICTAPCQAQIVAVTLQPPARDFGVFVGDRLTSTAILQVLPGTTLDARSLPPEGAVAADIDLRQVQTASTPTRIEIRVTYQSFFSPEQVLAAPVPGYTVSLSARGQRVSAAIPGFSFTASPFRHDLQPVLDAAALRPDHAPELVRAPLPLLAMDAGFVVAACGLLALTWPFRRSGRAAPFRDAVRRIAALQRDPPPDAAHQALLALHRAFDSTDGQRLFAGDIDGFLIRHSQFQPLRDRIAAFFDTSRAVFFGPGGSAPDLATCSALCRDLARAEQGG